MIYQSDQKHYFEQRNLSMSRKKDDDDEVFRKLVEFDIKMNSHIDNKKKWLVSVSKRAEDHVKVVMNKLDLIKHKDPEEDKDYTQLAKKFQK